MTTATVSKISPADLAHMERIDDDILNRVLAYQDRFDFADFTPADYTRSRVCFQPDARTICGAAFPAAMDYLEPMAQKALRLTRAQFGNTAALYTPLYIANYCVNECVYCGFNCKNKIQRGKLTPGEIEAEYETIAQTGLQEILILTGNPASNRRWNTSGKLWNWQNRISAQSGLKFTPLIRTNTPICSKKVRILSAYTRKPTTRKNTRKCICADRNAIFPTASIPRSGLCWAGCAGSGSVHCWAWTISGRTRFSQGCMRNFFNKNIPMRRSVFRCRACAHTSTAQRITPATSTNHSSCK